MTQLALGEVNCVVATASLELGIDVADLDLVVHDGAPTSPASYLQRLGRAGRRTGQRRMTLTTGESDDLLLTLAVLTRVRRNDIDPLPPQKGARLVLGQQALALAFGRFISDRSSLRDALRWSRVFAGLETEIDATVDHLLAGRWLQEDRGRVVVGAEGQRRFGGTTGLAKLLATFSSPEGAAVVDTSGQAVGTIDWQTVAEEEAAPRRGGLVLAGRTWNILEVDAARRVVIVEPGQAGRAPSWRGPLVEVGSSTWVAMREVLAGTDVPLVMDARASSWLEAARLSWAPRLAEPLREQNGVTIVDAFGGIAVHRAVLTALGVDGRAEGVCVELRCPLRELAERARRLLDDFDKVIDREAERQVLTLPVRHRELSAPTVLVAEARAFHVDVAGIRRVLGLIAGSPWPT